MVACGNEIALQRWLGGVKETTLLSLAIEFSLLVGATVGISFLLRVAQPNESKFELTMVG